MSHEHFEDLLLLSMTRAISEADRMELNAHLEACPECRAALAEWQQIARAVRLNAKERRMMVAARIRSMPNRGERALFPVLAVTLAVLCVAFFSFLVPPQTPPLAQVASPTEPVTVEILMAARDVPHGSVISDEDITLYQMPVDYVPFSALTDPSQVIGKIARTNIQCGLPILEAWVVENAVDVPDQPTLQASAGCNLPLLTEPIPVHEVTIAAQTIPAGTTLTNEMVVSRPYPLDLLPYGAITSPENLIGQVTVTDIYRESILMSWQLEPPRISIEVTIPIDVVQNADSTFNVGQQINIVATMMYVDVNGTMQAPVDGSSATSNPQTPHLITQEVVGGARITSRVFDENGQLTAVVVSVDSQAAGILTWVIDAQLPLVLTLP
ncbi:MAG: SAF domain-containing protein [Anaerolineae bacterium]